MALEMFCFKYTILALVLSAVTNSLGSAVRISWIRSILVSLKKARRLVVKEIGEEICKVAGWDVKIPAPLFL